MYTPTSASATSLWSAGASPVRLYSMLHQGLPRIPLLHKVWRSGSDLFVPGGLVALVPTKGTNLNEICILVSPPVMYKAVQLFLEALKTELTSIRPIPKYLVLCGGNLVDFPFDSPRYATTPHFLWDLSPLPPEVYNLDLIQNLLLQLPMLATYCGIGPKSTRGRR